MKLHQFFLSCLLVLISVYLSFQQDAKKITDLFYKRCHDLSHNSAVYDKLQSHIYDFTSYGQKVFSLIPDRKEQFCQNERKRLIDAFKEIANDMKSCLPYDEKYLSEFIYESFKEVLHFLCRARGANIENFFSNQGRDCIQNLEKANYSQEIGDCFKRIFPPSNGNFIKKQELCDNISVAEKCSSVLLDRHCKNFIAYQDLNRGFFESIRKPCSGSAMLLSNLLLLVICLFSRFFY